MIALVKTGRTDKTLPLPQIGMKALNILMVALVVLTQVMVAALKVIKANSLNPSLAEESIVKVAAVVIAAILARV